MFRWTMKVRNRDLLLHTDLKLWGLHKAMHKNIVITSLSKPQDIMHHGKAAEEINRELAGLQRLSADLIQRITMKSGDIWTDAIRMTSAIFRNIGTHNLSNQLVLFNLFGATVGRSSVQSADPAVFLWSSATMWVIITARKSILSKTNNRNAILPVAMAEKHECI